MEINESYPFKMNRLEIFKYILMSRYRLFVEKIKTKYINKRNKILDTYFKEINKNDFVIFLENKFFHTIAEIQKEFCGMRDFYSIIDKNTYDKYVTLCKKYDEECNKKIKNSNIIINFIFNIKPNVDSQRLGKHNIYTLVKIKHVLKPEFKFIVLGNNLILDKDENDIKTITIKLSETKSPDIIKEIDLNEYYNNN